MRVGSILTLLLKLYSAINEWRSGEYIGGKFAAEIYQPLYIKFLARLEMLSSPKADNNRSRIELAKIRKRIAEAGL